MLKIWARFISLEWIGNIIQLNNMDSLVELFKFIEYSAVNWKIFLAH